MNLIKKISFIFLVMSLFSFSFLGIVLAQDPKPGEKIVDINFPCVDCDISNSTSIIEYIVKFYKFGIAIVGIVAVGMIVAGGIYISMSGAVDKKSEGKEMITSAILGITLLFGSYIILRTINPDLVNLKDPGAFMDEKKPTVDQGAIDALGKKFASAFCGSVASSTDPLLIKSMLPADSGQSDCKYRKFIATKDIGIEDNSSEGEKYYDEDETVPSGSTVWQYPYFIKTEDAASTAKCLVYAYKEPDEDIKSSVTFIDLDPRLGVCQLSDQQVMNVQGQPVGRGGEYYYGTCLEWKLRVKNNDNGSIMDLGPVPVNADFNYKDAGDHDKISTDITTFQQSVKDKLGNFGDYTPEKWFCSKVDSSSLEQCSSKTECAAKFGVSPIDKNSPELTSLIKKIRNDFGGDLFDKLYKQNTNNRDGRMSTYGVSYNLCNQTRGVPTVTQPTCAHSKYSCHYGGKDEKYGKDGAMAVDFGNASAGINNSTIRVELNKSVCAGVNAAVCQYKIWQKILEIAKKYNGGAYASCEAGEPVSCSSGKADHLHISVSPCKG